MVVAAHISPGSELSRLFPVVKFLSAGKPAVQFILFSETATANAKVASNIQQVAVKSGKSNLRLRFWYTYQLPSLLKKYKADLFISEYGTCSSKANIPQLLWLNDIAFLDKQSVYRSVKDPYLRKHFLQFAHKSNAILVTYDYMRDRLLKQYNLPEEKFVSTGNWFGEAYKPIEWDTKQALLNDISNATEYFYCECNAITKGHITTLLKAFSLFKKRLKSGLKLVLLLDNVSLEDCVKDFRLYKYREDVVVKTRNDNDHPAAALMAASYAVIHLPKEITGFEEKGLPAMLSAVPLITTDAAEHHSLYRDAALFSQPAGQSIADNMMLLYKDEDGRAKHIEKGLELSATYTLPRMAERLWQTILAALPENAQ